MSDVDNPQGTYTTASGDKFIGKFMDNASICNEFDPGKFIGEVEFRTASGKYIGPYKEGRVMGRGKFIHDNGDVYEGEFYDGVLNTNVEYYVSITFPGGERYEGVSSAVSSTAKVSSQCPTATIMKARLSTINSPEQALCVPLHPKEFMRGK